MLSHPKGCPKVYIGETGRIWCEGRKEHMKGMKQLGDITPVPRKESQTEHHQSARTDDAAVCNHSIDWEGVKLPSKDSDWSKRGIRRPSALGRQGHTPSITMRGTTISLMCILSCCSQPPHLVVMN